MKESSGVGSKLKREVACLQCGTIQHADNEFCEHCRTNLFETIGCDQCNRGPVTKEINTGKCILKNIKGRCRRFDQKDLELIKEAREERDGINVE